jgi:hypothetical protein
MGPPVIHLVDEQECTPDPVRIVTLCGEAHGENAKGKLPRNFFFAWLPDDDDNADCQMCLRELRRREAKPAVLVQ